MSTRLVTRQVLEVLGGVKYHTLLRLIRIGKIPEPERDGNGLYAWSPADIKRAREALQIDRRRKEHRQRKAVAQ